MKSEAAAVSAGPGSLLDAPSHPAWPNCGKTPGALRTPAEGVRGTGLETLSPSLTACSHPNGVPQTGGLKEQKWRLEVQDQGVSRFGSPEASLLGLQLAASLPPLHTCPSVPAHPWCLSICPDFLL